jgi:hypothetical protein
MFSGVRVVSQMSSSVVLMGAGDPFEGMHNLEVVSKVLAQIS